MGLIEVCQWEEYECGHYVEGKTMYCGTHNTMLRKRDRMEKYNASKAKPKTIKKVSEKRKEVLKDYTALRKQYLIKHPTCEIKLLGICTGFSIEIHHCSTSALDHNNEYTWKASCIPCHRHTEQVLSGQERRDKGLLI